MDRHRRKYHGLRNAVRIAAQIIGEVDPRLVVQQGQLDAKPELLNCWNGTLNLRIGALADHDPDDLLTKIAPINYNRNAAAPKWREFISRFSCNDRGLGELQSAGDRRGFAGQSGERGCSSSTARLEATGKRL